MTTTKPPRPSACEALYWAGTVVLALLAAGAAACSYAVVFEYRHARSSGQETIYGDPAGAHVVAAAVLTLACVLLIAGAVGCMWEARGLSAARRERRGYPLYRNGRLVGRVVDRGVQDRVPARRKWLPALRVTVTIERGDHQ